MAASVVVIALVGAGVVVATIERQDQEIGSGAGPSTESAVGDSPSRGSREEPSTSAQPEGSSIPPALNAPAIGFDLERLGPLSADADGVALVLGAPEVAALPTSFDRSLRLGAAGDGICLAVLPDGSSARSLTVDVVVGARRGTDLVITPTDRVDDTVTVAFDEIPGLAPGAWYRLRVAWDAGGPSLEVTERDDVQAIHRAPLQTSAPPSRPATGSICIEADRVTGEGDLHLDNVRVET